MRKISILLCLSLILTAVGCSRRSAETSGGVENIYTYLVVGFDDAAENTDVIFTVTYEQSTNTARIAQIPRDTYCNSGFAQNKINQIYASYRQDGVASREALRTFASYVSSVFGADFDGFFGITTPTFRRVVDAIGGIEIELKTDLVLDADGDTLVLKVGKNKIYGSDAEKFIRYRSGYAMGDLGRIDAQKIFLNALFGKLSNSLGLCEMIKLANEFQKEVITDVRLIDLIPIATAAFRSSQEKKAFYVTVPGEPVINDKGLSFYIINRKSAAEIANRYMHSSCEFDSERRLCNSNDDAAINIYYDETIFYREYSSENVNNIHIPKK